MDEEKKVTFENHVTRIVSGLMTRNHEKTVNAIYEVAFEYVQRTEPSDEAHKIADLCAGLSDARKMLVRAVLTAMDRGEL